MKVLVLFLYIFLSLEASALADKKSNDNLSKQDRKWKNVNSLLTKEIKTIKSLGRLGPRLRYRLLELYSERIKLIRINENQFFMKATSSQLKKKGKKSYYKKSNKQYKNTERYGLNIIKKFPHFINNADIYYTLAINSRDYDNKKKTEYYLKHALRNAQKASPIVHQIKTSLAEYYYNEKRYEEAIYNYRTVLKNKDDEWQSKHQFNNAWCLFKVRQHEQAISGLKKAYILSKSKRFIDVRDQVFETIGVFHVHANKVEEGVSFYLQELKEPTAHLIKMANKASAHIGLPSAEYVFKMAIDDSRKRNNLINEMEINLSQLKLYRSFKKENRYFNTAVNIKSINKRTSLPKELIDEAVTEIRSKVGFLQVKFSKANLIDVDEYNKKDLKVIITYFSVLKALDATKKDEYTYFQSETYFAAKEYKLAAKNYAKALKYSYKKKNNKELQRKIINSLLALLDRANFGKNKKYKLTQFTYKHHIKIWPKDAVSQKIYPKYFNLLMNKAKAKKSYSVLQKYMTNYPNDKKIQRPLFTQLFDLDVKNKNKAQVTMWISKLQKGFLSFDPVYIKKSILILGQILFKELEQLKKQGKIEEVLIGHKSIYKNETYPKKIKAEAALEISNILLRKGTTKESFSWLKKSIKNYEGEEFLANQKYYMDMANLYIIFQDFGKAAAINEYIILNQCKKKIKLSDGLLNQAIQYRLIEARFKYALKILNKYKKCKISSSKLSSIESEIISFLYRNNQIKSMKSLLKLSIWSRHHYKINTNLKEYDKLRIEKENSKNQKGLMKQLFVDIKFEEMPTSKPFDDKKLNTAIETNFKKLKEFESTLSSFLKSKNPEVSLLAHRYLANAYDQISKIIFNYNPQGVPKKFKKTLKAQLNPLAHDLSKQGKSLINNVINDIEKKQFLSNANMYVTMDQKIQKNLKFQYPAAKLSSAIDFPEGL